MVGHFIDVWRAETAKLFSRATAKVGLVVAALLGVFGPLALWAVLGMDVTTNEGPVADRIAQTAPMALQWGLEARNFFVLKMFIIVLVALSVAGEYKARTIREDLVRPVPRWMVPMGKWAAVSTWSAASLLIGWVFGGLLAVIAFGVDGEWTRLLAGYGVTFLTDVAFASLVMVVAIASRSVAGTVAGVFLFIVLDWMLGTALWLISQVSSFFAQAGLELSETLERAIALKPWLPSAAFGVWSGFKASADWEWRSFVSLAVITVVCAVASERVFNRLDVP